MKIQSLSIVVPNKKCINNCKFCVSRMREDIYTNMMDENLPFYDLYERDYIKRLEFARDNGCNTVMLTGETEPQQNRKFLQRFGSINNNLSSPFRWIEMQTTGVLLEDSYLRFLRNHVGISTISLSISSFDMDKNAEYHQTPDKAKVDIFNLCRSICKYDFNLRLSLNMTNCWEKLEVKELFGWADNLNADQITFRIFYTSSENTEQDKWINANKASEYYISSIRHYILDNGIALETLEFGQTRYSVHGLSVVLDDDCMATQAKSSLKYLILRPNCKLYSKWNDKASLLF